MKKTMVSFFILAYAVMIGLLTVAIIETPEAKMSVMIAGGGTPATAPACPFDGDYIETFESGPDQTWTLGGSVDTWTNESKASDHPGTTCEGADVQRFADNDGDTCGYSWNLTVNPIASGDALVTLFMYVNSLVFDTTGDNGQFLIFADAGGQWQFGTDIEFYYDGTNYDITNDTNLITFANNITIPGWVGLQIHLDYNNAAASWIKWDDDLDGDFSDESGTTFTRASESHQYVHICYKDGGGSMDPGDIMDFEIAYITVDIL